MKKKCRHSQEWSIVTGTPGSNVWTCCPCQANWRPKCMSKCLFAEGRKILRLNNNVSPHLLTIGRCEGYPIPRPHHIVDYEGLGWSHCAPRTRTRQDMGRGHRVLGLDHLSRSGGHLMDPLLMKRSGHWHNSFLPTFYNQGSFLKCEFLQPLSRFASLELIKLKFAIQGKSIIFYKMRTENKKRVCDQTW